MSTLLVWRIFYPENICDALYYHEYFIFPEQKKKLLQYNKLLYTLALPKKKTICYLNIQTENFYPQIEKNFHKNICLYILDTTTVG